MSPHFIELIVLGTISFVLITKLLSILGKRDNPEGSFFGERTEDLQDVTDTSVSASIQRLRSIKSDIEKIEAYVVPTNIASVREGLKQIEQKMSNFDIARFVKIAGKVFLIIRGAIEKNDLKTLQELVDANQIDRVKLLSGKHQSIKSSTLTSRISEIYMFGNFIYIKVLMKADASESKILKQEWTFIHKLQDKTSSWMVSDVEEV